jgi:copper chaperone CopZ
VVKRTTPGGTARGDTEASAVNAGSCCPPRATGSSRPSSSKDSAERSGILASGGALVAAVLSSACCWLPLVAVGLGASSAGVGAFFATWRVPLLLATVALLGAGFYLAYRKPRCVPGEACEAPSPRLRRFHRGMLWLMAVFAVAVASFPEYVGAFSQGGNATGVAPGQASAHYRIEGMSCAGCEGHASEAIRTIPGVVAVTVSYRDRSAKVVWSGEANDTAVADALSELGYRSTRIR